MADRGDSFAVNVQEPVTGRTQTWTGFVTVRCDDYTYQLLQKCLQKAYVRVQHSCLHAFHST